MASLKRINSLATGVFISLCFMLAVVTATEVGGAQKPAGNRVTRKSWTAAMYPISTHVGSVSINNGTSETDDDDSGPDSLPETETQTIDVDDSAAGKDSSTGFLNTDDGGALKIQSFAAFPVPESKNDSVLGGAPLATAVFNPSTRNAALKTFFVVVFLTMGVVYMYLSQREINAGDQPLPGEEQRVMLLAAAVRNLQEQFQNLVLPPNG